jgi:hypothetical protein
MPDVFGSIEWGWLLVVCVGCSEEPRQPTHTTNQQTNQPANQQTNTQPTNQPTNHPTIQPTNKH